jgi:hydrogenase maturation protein HypF
MEQTTYKITITGVVQGVGFRPFVYQCAKHLELCGEVYNTALGLIIMINSSQHLLEDFVALLQKETPPLAKIVDIMIEERVYCHYDDFSIVESQDKTVVSTLMPPDVSICKACEAELFDSSNRRYRYPFITCTHCGVRYSIIKHLPYDRENTSMQSFPMCQVCEAEYNNPLDRRYHAQPIGCFSCGPRLSISIEEGIDMLKDGKILAVKGVGGYHLMCDATNTHAIERLRKRKHRPTKPFAVMVRDIKEAEYYAYIDDKEAQLLQAKERPIVLLKSKNTLSVEVAPHLSKIGIFLPYTPLHLLLLDAIDVPLVATSANVSDEPICTDIDALKQLDGVYDGVIDHDREIVNGCDDSVVMVVENQTIMIRRARGYAPASIRLPFALDKRVLALGANQKSTVAIGFEREVILSPHIGDLDTIASVEYFEKNIETLRRIYAFEPDIVVHDLHPEYESSKYAKANYHDRREIQHHYAHILGVMAEKGIENSVLGVAFDGTGLGEDKTLWGGEFLICHYGGYERVGYLKPFKLLGGAKAIKEPRRVALSLLFDTFGKKALEMDNPTIRAFSTVELKSYFLAWQKGLNAPLSSSMGRLFDAVASMFDVCQVMSFEGESGMLLEELYDESIEEIYPFDYHDSEINILPMIEGIVKDESVVGVSKFFNTVVEIIMIVQKRYGLPLVLSGGVFQNRVLLSLILQKIPGAIVPNEIPPNDGGIALGQVVSQLVLLK